MWSTLHSVTLYLHYDLMFMHQINIFFFKSSETSAVAGIQDLRVLGSIPRSAKIYQRFKCYVNVTLFCNNAQ